MHVVLKICIGSNWIYSNDKWIFKQTKKDKFDGNVFFCIGNNQDYIIHEIDYNGRHAPP